MIRVIRWAPGIQMIAITGSVAAGNARAEDDIDLLVVTSANMLWVVRPLILLLISIFFRRRLPHEDPSKSKDAFCPNLWLDQKSLILPISKRNLYTAHEVLQVIPIFDKEHTYNQFIHRNSWTKHFLANAYSAAISGYKNRHSGLGPARVLGTRGESIQIKHLISIFLIPLNHLFYLVQLLYMLPKKTSETVNLHAAFLHTNSYSENLARHLSRVKVI